MTNIKYRYNKIIDELIINGFNQTLAYMKVYKVDYASAMSESSRLLRNVKFIEILNKRMNEIDIEQLNIERKVALKLYNLMDSAKKESDQINSAIWLGKIKGLFTERIESKQDVSIQQNRSILDAVNDRLSRN